MRPLRGIRPGTRYGLEEAPRWRSTARSSSSEERQERQRAMGVPLLRQRLRIEVAAGRGFITRAEAQEALRRTLDQLHNAHPW
jgi:hypothetical protein